MTVVVPADHAMFKMIPKLDSADRIKCAAQGLDLFNEITAIRILFDVLRVSSRCPGADHSRTTTSFSFSPVSVLSSGFIPLILYHTWSKQKNNP